MMSSREIVVLIAEGDVRLNIADIIDAVKSASDNKKFHNFEVLSVLEKAREDDFFRHLGETLSETGNEMIRDYVEEVLKNEKEKDA